MLFDQYIAENFQESIKKIYIYIFTIGKQKGREGKFSSELLTKILKHFGVYFKLHQPNHAGLGILGKSLLAPQLN